MGRRKKVLPPPAPLFVTESVPTVIVEMSDVLAALNTDRFLSVDHICETILVEINTGDHAPLVVSDIAPQVALLLKDAIINEWVSRKFARSHYVHALTNAGRNKLA